jgi:hypothetical protein
MSKKKRSKGFPKRKPVSNQSPMFQQYGTFPADVKTEVEEYFSEYQGKLERITYALTEELVASGKYSREYVKNAKDNGMRYSRKTGTFWMGSQ